MAARTRFSLWHGAAASALIHACLVLPFFVPWHLLQAKQQQTLVIELQGMISNRQEEQKTAGAQQPATPPPEVRQEPPKPEEKPQPEKKKVVKKTMPAPPIPKKPVLQPVHEEVASLPMLPAPAGEAAQQQVPQTIRSVDADMEAFKAYLAKLKRKLQTNLVYPDSAKLSGLRGTAVVGFAVTETGDIREESLRIIKSSGFPDLDRNALSTVRSSAPFDKPQKEITVAVAVSFEVKN